jgi:hypothetical protein
MKNRCPKEYPYSFLQQNRCCDNNKETRDFEDKPKGNHCNLRELGAWSICCDGKSVHCTNKPCFDFKSLNAGKKIDKGEHQDVSNQRSTSKSKLKFKTSFHIS